MSLKYCSQCSTAVEHVIFECPSCKGSMFVHQDPALVPAADQVASELTRLIPVSTHPRVPVPKPLTPEEIKAAQLLALDEELGEARVSAYRTRMKKELEEIRYRHWRNLQPEWESVAQNAQEVNNRTPAPKSGTPMKVPMTGAAAAIIGTAGIRMQLNDIQNQLNNEDVSGGEDSGIGDFFSGLFE